MFNTLAQKQQMSDLGVHLSENLPKELVLKSNLIEYWFKNPFHLQKLLKLLSENLPKELVSESDILQYGIENPLELNRYLTPAILERKFLTSLTSIVLDKDKIRARDFFVKRLNISRCHGLDKFLLNAVFDNYDFINKLTIGYADVSTQSQNIYDSEVCSELPEGYVFEDDGTFLDILATLIHGQMDGNNGVLVTPFRDSIFYVMQDGMLMNVSVRWLPAYNQWFIYIQSVESRKKGHYTFDIGCRAFSANIT